MGIKKQVQVTYTTDRGIEMELCEMESTHLLNAIAHHRNQVETIKFAKTTVSDSDGLTNLDNRQGDLEDTIEMLCAELASRDPAMEI